MLALIFNVPLFYGWASLHVLLGHMLHCSPIFAMRPLLRFYHPIMLRTSTHSSLHDNLTPLSCEAVNAHSHSPSTNFCPVHFLDGIHGFLLFRKGHHAKASAQQPVY